MIQKIKMSLNTIQLPAAQHSSFLWGRSKGDMKLCDYRSYKTWVFLEEIQLGEATDLWQGFSTRNAPKATQLLRAVRQHWSGSWEMDGEGGQEPPAQLLQLVSGTPWRHTSTQTDLQKLLLASLSEGWLISVKQCEILNAATSFLSFLPFFFLCSHSGLQAERQVKLSWEQPAKSRNQTCRECFLRFHTLSYSACRQPGAVRAWSQCWKNGDAFLHLSPFFATSTFAHSICWAITDEHMQKLK